MSSLVRWSNAIAVAAMAVIVVFIYGQEGNWASAVIAAAALLVIAWLLSPLFGRKGESWAELRDMPPSSRGVVIFWRPGCVFCFRMKALLGPTGRKAHWVNIWRDADAAAFVRENNNGNETVPTVILDGAVHTNPEPTVVRRELVKS